ncbi:DEAD/DEAH box helicase [Candidatus Pacearchaeota archaeon]|nr:DEAD/DEAH box helicase [Candidatus Pacearchaeota archaeon]
MEFLQDISPRDYQKQIFETCKEKNCLVVLPTGLGKTLVGLMITIHRMKQFPGEKVLFLAPTRPLAEQHLNYFKKHLPELFGEMTLFTGKIDAYNRKKLWQFSDIIFSTPQCIANDLKKNLYNLTEVCLLIEDEAHRCLKNYDYNYVAKEYNKYAGNPRIIGLTASPGSDKQKIKEICNNLKIEEVELRQRESSDVKEYLQELKFEKIKILFPKEFEEIRHTLKKIYERYVEELRSRSVLYGPATKTSLIQLQNKISTSLARGNRNFNYMLAASACAQAIKLQYAMELLETQTLKGFTNYLETLLNKSKTGSRGIKRLVAKPEFTFSYLRAKELLEKNVEHPKLSHIKELVKKEKEKNERVKIIVFAQFRETASIISENLNTINGIRAKVFIGQAKRGSGKDQRGLSQKEQQQIIQEFSQGKINVLCATSIGEEGLDIPEVNAVIFYEPVPSAIRKIQRAGRTARLMQGKLIILITQKTRDEAYYYVSRAKEKKMYSAIDSIKQELKEPKKLKQKIQEKLSKFIP